MKTYHDMIWSEENQGVVSIGFTQAFIDGVLTECFHITQSGSILATKGKPMLTIETNEGLKTIKAPVTGTITHFSQDARDFPDCIREDNVIVQIKLKSNVVMPTVAKTVGPNTRAANNYAIQDEDLTPAQLRIRRETEARNRLRNPFNNNNNNRGW